MNSKRRAIFFDRDGVLNKDVNLLFRPEDLVIPEDTLEACRHIKGADCLKIVVSNQTVICRGLASLEQVQNINEIIRRRILDLTGCSIDRFYICPHHPEATLESYREKCKCRKPEPGMLLKAAEDFGIDLGKSWMIGDRISDIVAGRSAGCGTILVRTGMHEENPIVSDNMDLSVSPDYSCDTVLEAVRHILDEWGIR